MLSGISVTYDDHFQLNLKGTFLWMNKFSKIRNQMYLFDYALFIRKKNM